MGMSVDGMKAIGKPNLSFLSLSASAVFSQVDLCASDFSRSASRSSSRCVGHTVHGVPFTVLSSRSMTA